VFADASFVEAHAPLAIERDTPANPNAGRALLRRLRLEERFVMAQFSTCLDMLNQSLIRILVPHRHSAQVSKKSGIA
jgi:hypothetical protein